MDEFFEAKFETPNQKQDAFAAGYAISQSDRSKWFKNASWFNEKKAFPTSGKNIFNLKSQIWWYGGRTGGEF